MSEKSTKGTDIVLVIDADSHGSAYGLRGDERLFGARGPREEFIDSEGNVIERENKIPRIEVNWDAVRDDQKPEKLVEIIDKIRKMGITAGHILPKESDQQVTSKDTTDSKTTNTTSENEQSSETKDSQSDFESVKMEE